LDQEDAIGLADSEEITLMDWGNCIINKVHRQDGLVVSVDATLHLEGDFKLTKKKLTWLPALEPSPLVTCSLIEYDTLVTTKDIPKGKDFKQFVTACSKFVTSAVTDSSIIDLKPGDKLQFERLGYFVLDSIVGNHFNFIQFPDGHETNKFLSCKVAIRKY